MYMKTWSRAQLVVSTDKSGKRAKEKEKKKKWQRHKHVAFYQRHFAVPSCKIALPPSTQMGHIVYKKAFIMK